VRKHGAGDEPATRAREAATRRLRAPGLLELEELLSTHLDTRVKVEMGTSKGRVLVEFATLEDLERIYRAMTGGAGPGGHQQGPAGARGHQQGPAGV
jgi:ParB family chromosome partitioning protein